MLFSIVFLSFSQLSIFHLLLKMQYPSAWGIASLSRWIYGIRSHSLLLYSNFVRAPSYYTFCAMLNYGIIEMERIVILSTICLLALNADSATIWSTVLQEILVNILSDGLTSISFPHTFRVGHLNYTTFYETNKTIHNKLTYRRA